MGPGLGETGCQGLVWTKQAGLKWDGMGRTLIRYESAAMWLRRPSILLGDCLHTRHWINKLILKTMRAKFLMVVQIYRGRRTSKNHGTELEILVWTQGLQHIWTDAEICMWKYIYIDVFRCPLYWKLAKTITFQWLWAYLAPTSWFLNTIFLLKGMRASWRHGWY